MDQRRYEFRVGINTFIIKRGKLLLGLRKNIFGDGTWGLPGGHLEDREDMIATAKREVLEETGLRVKQLKFVNLVNQPRNIKHYIQIAFLASNIIGEPKLMEPEECAEWKWFDIKKLPRNIFPPHKLQIQLFLKKKNFQDTP